MSLLHARMVGHDPEGGVEMVENAYLSQIKFLRLHGLLVARLGAISVVYCSLLLYIAIMSVPYNIFPLSACGCVMLGIH